MDPSELTREDLSRRPVSRIFPRRNRTKARVAVIGEGSDCVVVKDFLPTGFWVRNTIGRFSIARECRAYRRLASVSGVPRFHGRIDAFAFACAYVPGRSLSDLARTGVPREFFETLRTLLANIHERGVAIADLHHRNVLIEDRSGAPALIDFSLALVRPSWLNVPGRWLYARAVALDEVALERIRERYEAPSHEARAAGPRPGRLHRAGRALKSLLRRARGRA